MASLSMNNKIKRNQLSKISSSNKDILIRTDDNKKDLIYHNDLHDKNISKKNIISINTSVKKIKQIKKISINDYDTKQSKNTIKNYSLKNKIKLDISNKENHIINQKEKKEKRKITHKKILNNIADMKQKVKINKNAKMIIKKNKLSKSEKNLDNDYKKIKGEQTNDNINNDINIYTNKTVYAKKDEGEDTLLNTLESQDIEYIYRQEPEIFSDHRIQYSSRGSYNTLIPLIRMRKKHINYTFRRQSSTINFNKRNNLSNNGTSNATYLKRYNSNNNGIGNNKNYIDIINNFDIINIINKKEETKRLSASIQNYSSTYRTQNLSKKIKRCSLKKNKTSKNVNISISTKSNHDYKELEINEKNNSNAPLTMRNPKPLNNNISTLNSRLNNNTDKNFLNNKWEKKYFIPIVSASLINGEEKIQIHPNQLRKKNKMNKNIHFLKAFTNNTRKSINFGENNKKKREMLFNNINEKIENEKINYISFQSKRTNSLTLRRDRHITERNNSNNNKKINDDKILNNDLIIQQKKLELISNEINKEKEKANKAINNVNRFCISMDNICIKAHSQINGKNKNHQENNTTNNINNRKYKTFHIKINSLNKSKGSNKNHKCNNSMIIRRGDLLNKLRKMKYNYSLKEQ